jgi:MHS family proline/betaine transporter-like MFS transporter
MSDSSKITQHLKRNIFGGVVGNVLEWYDFAVFGFFAPVIGSQFFPSDNPMASLIKTFGVFAAGYLMRPIGGIIFGHFGDKLGRKRALQLSVMMMAIPTTLIGFLPTHAQIGLAAPILLVLIRLIQGVSVGGELVGSISFITEIAPKNRRGFFGSFSVCSAVGGILLGSAIATIAHGLFDPQFLKTWGWRIPFMLGFAIGGFGLWMRKGMVETPEFEKVKEAGAVGRSPVIEAVTSMPGRIFHVVAMLVLYAGGFYMLFVWWPTYLTKIVVPPISHALMINTISMVVLMILMPAAGYLSDLIGRKTVLAAAFLGTAVLAYPLVIWTDHGMFGSALISQLIFAVLIAGALGPMAATLVELFPTRIRFSGIGVSYNITLAIFGGTAPLVSTWLVSRTGDIEAPAYYLIVMSIISLIATLTIRKKLGGDLED